jgi:hypothetical protein
MREPGPAPLQDVVAQLTAHAVGQDLAARAMEGCRRWLATTPEEWPYALSDIRMEFASQALYFRNVLLPYPYIETRLRLFVDEDEVGHYRLITLPDGREEDDYLVFE